VLVYKRFEDRLMAEPLEKLYREVWEPLNNFFCRVRSFESQSPYGEKVQRGHDKPKTPCDQLLESEHVSLQSKEELRVRRAALEPFLIFTTGSRRGYGGGYIWPAVCL